MYSILFCPNCDKEIVLHHEDYEFIDHCDECGAELNKEDIHCQVNDGKNSTLDEPDI